MAGTATPNVEVYSKARDTGIRSGTTGACDFCSGVLAERVRNGGICTISGVVTSVVTWPAEGRNPFAR